MIIQQRIWQLKLCPQIVLFCWCSMKRAAPCIERAASGPRVRGIECAALGIERRAGTPSSWPCCVERAASGIEFVARVMERAARGIEWAVRSIRRVAHSMPRAHCLARSAWHRALPVQRCYKAGGEMSSCCDIDGDTLGPLRQIIRWIFSQKQIIRESLSFAWLDSFGSLFVNHFVNYSRNDQLVDWYFNLEFRSSGHLLEFKTVLWLLSDDYSIIIWSIIWSIIWLIVFIIVILLAMLGPGSGRHSPHPAMTAWPQKRVWLHRIWASSNYLSAPTRSRPLRTCPCPPTSPACAPLLAKARPHGPSASAHARQRSQSNSMEIQFRVRGSQTFTL